MHIWRYRLTVRTPALHAGNPGSNPGSVTKEKQKFLCKTNVRFADLRLIWPGRLVARTPTSQVGKRGIETLSGHQYSLWKQSINNPIGKIFVKYLVEIKFAVWRLQGCH